MEDVRQLGRRTAGRTLRHWTTNGELFVGVQRRARSNVPDRDVTDPCRMNLVVSKLNSMRAQRLSGEST